MGVEGADWAIEEEEEEVVEGRVWVCEWVCEWRGGREEEGGSVVTEMIEAGGREDWGVGCWVGSDFVGGRDEVGTGEEERTGVKEEEDDDDDDDRRARSCDMIM